MFNHRFIKTHLPLHLLPTEVRDQKKAKVIYMYRNPKDVIISYYFFARMLTAIDFLGTLDDFAWFMMFNEAPYTPYFGHINGYMQASKSRPQQFLAVSYEDMKQNPEKVIEQIANFLKIPLSADLKAEVVKKSSFDSMKANPTTNYEHWEKWGLKKPGEADFMRKGMPPLISDFFLNPI